MSQPPTPPCLNIPAQPPPVRLNWQVDPTAEARPTGAGLRIGVIGHACIDCGREFVRSFHVLPTGDGVYRLPNLADRRCPTCDLTRQLEADVAAYNALPFWRRLITRRPGHR